VVKAFFRNEIEPFYFGVSPKRLYGCHHLPQSSNAKACSIVICCPIGQEYIRSHRAVYQLAAGLTRAGYNVLRFDYFGCGDSEGDFEQGALVQWTDDTVTAIEEIQKRSPVRSVCLIGLRVGAALALYAAARSSIVKSIILWEPVIDGARYLKELIQNQQDFLGRYRGKLKQALAGSFRSDEVLGFPMTSELRQDLEAMNINQLRLCHDLKSLIVYSNNDSSYVEKLNRLIHGHSRTTIQMIADPKVWAESLYKRLIPHRTLDYLVNWASTLDL
jgi:alpha-beta hydrolase superfamily lysophospholipase